MIFFRLINELDEIVREIKSDKKGAEQVPDLIILESDQPDYFIHDPTATYVSDYETIIYKRSTLTLILQKE